MSNKICKYKRKLIFIPISFYFTLLEWVKTSFFKNKKAQTLLETRLTVRKFYFSSSLLLMIDLFLMRFEIFSKEPSFSLRIEVKNYESLKKSAINFNCRIIKFHIKLCINIETYFRSLYFHFWLKTLKKHVQ